MRWWWWVIVMAGMRLVVVVVMMMIVMVRVMMIMAAVLTSKMCDNVGELGRSDQAKSRQVRGLLCEGVVVVVAWLLMERPSMPGPMSAAEKGYTTPS